MEFSINPFILTAYCEKLVAVHQLRITFLPAAVELKIYEFTVRQAMQLLFEEVWKHEKREIIGHCFQLEIVQTYGIPPIPKSVIHRCNLEAFATRLMNNDLINLPWLPHYLKKQLLENILLLLMISLTGTENQSPNR